MNTEREKSDTQSCEACGGRTALVKGNWYFAPDAEPYVSGTEESAPFQEMEEYVHGYVCDECERVQGMWIDDQEPIKQPSPTPSGEVMSLEECLDKFATEMYGYKKFERCVDHASRKTIINIYKTATQLYTQQFKDKSAALEQENRRLREALQDIKGLHKGIHANYTIHDAFKEANEIADEALQQTDNDKTGDLQKGICYQCQKETEVSAPFGLMLCRPCFNDYVDWVKSKDNDKTE